MSLKLIAGFEECVSGKFTVMVPWVLQTRVVTSPVGCRSIPEGAFLAVLMGLLIFQNLVK